MRWDNREHEFSFTYDSLRRPVASAVKTGNDDAITYSKTEYGELLPPATAKANNLRGIACKMYDQSGINTITKRFQKQPAHQYTATDRQLQNHH